MEFYEIKGEPYTLEDLILDLKVARSGNDESIRIIIEAENRDLLRSKIFDNTGEKIDFFKEVLGYLGLYGRGGGLVKFIDCHPARIGQAFQKTIMSHMQHASPEIREAKSRIEEYKAIVTSDYQRQKEATKKALEDFERDHPNKYKANLIGCH